MELEQSGDTLELLTEAFMSLKKYDRSLCLKVSDDEEIHVGAQGCFSGALGKVYEEEGVFKLYWKEVMSSLIKAVADSGCRVTRLSLENVTDADLIGEGKLWDDDLDEDVNRLSVSLTAFDVEVHCRDLHAVSKSIKQVMSQAKNLEILTFEPSGPHLYYDLAGFCHSVASNSLEAINLSSLCCSVSDLISFLSKHKSTLDHF
jgi:hypothetical protein